LKDIFLLFFKLLLTKFLTMKGIIIFLLLVIVSILGYNQYQKYQRFHPNYVNYVSSDAIDNNYYDPKVVMNYYKNIEDLNGFVISQWSTNGIDVRHPEKDNAATTYAMSEYQKKLGEVRYYEAILQQSTAYKAKGLSNEEIEVLEQNQLTEEALYENQQRKEFYILFEKALSKKPLEIGDQGPWVYELQKNLIREGYVIAVDGKFKVETYNALKEFEEKNQLYADGILDILTLSKMLKHQKSMVNPLLAIQ